MYCVPRKMQVPPHLCRMNVGPDVQLLVGARRCLLRHDLLANVLATRSLFNGYCQTTMVYFENNVRQWLPRVNMWPSAQLVYKTVLMYGCSSNRMRRVPRGCSTVLFGQQRRGDWRKGLGKHERGDCQSGRGEHHLCRHEFVWMIRITLELAHVRRFDLPG